MKVTTYTVRNGYARYYSSDLSIWLSVDPMADKYPTMSPYVYCANNPVKLVDPNGEEVVIVGDQAEKAVSTLSTKNISVSRDSETGKLSYEGKAINRDERLLVKAIESDKVTVNLTANKSNVISIDENGNETTSRFGGAFMGNSLIFNKKGNAISASTQQFVSMDGINANFDVEDIGDVIAHEITESYKGGVISMRNGEAALPALGKNKIYDKAHNRASYQPYMKSAITVLFLLLVQK